jgi:hypothetical protein
MSTVAEERLGRQLAHLSNIERLTTSQPALECCLVLGCAIFDPDCPAQFPTSSRKRFRQAMSPHELELTQVPLFGEGGPENLLLPAVALRQSGKKQPASGTVRQGK